MQPWLRDSEQTTWSGPSARNWVTWVARVCPKSSGPVISASAGDRLYSTAAGVRPILVAVAAGVFHCVGVTISVTNAGSVPIGQLDRTAKSFHSGYLAEF